ncbi:unnamed protein product [Danaus chrysippus]|uniref:(African queen) hypothetical protein n=1 Tax=Danaus chrysippus TaxID=151541 RepID=A0A8J2W5T2_9NEOP|nr:unnamed protein product [Danaus chrysippus]
MVGLEQTSRYIAQSGFTNWDAGHGRRLAPAHPTIVILHDSAVYCASYTLYGIISDQFLSRLASFWDPPYCPSQLSVVEFIVLAPLRLAFFMFLEVSCEDYNMNNIFYGNQ